LSTRWTLLALLLVSACSWAAQFEKRVAIPARDFDSVLPIAPGKNRVHVDAFRIDRAPVTNAEFASFVQAHPEWQRGRVPALYADREYLSSWKDTRDPGAAIETQPATRVSWFAASAYCSARGARLPTWYEWEFVAAASETERDARANSQWRQRILDWYAAPGGRLSSVGSRPANFYGVHDMHGLIWEWVEDFNGMLVSADSREQGDGNIARFCGTGALSMEQKEQYAILMRIAMLSSLQAHYTTANLGFRCAESK
jgi:formylglycine-generating enzyme required for sulfatase activity